MTREEEIKFRDECAIKILAILVEQVMLGNMPRTREQYEEDPRNVYQMAFDDAESFLEEKKKRDEKLS